MSVKLGLFTMPFHHPDRDYGQILHEDQEAIVLADRLGFTEAFVGEHFSSWSERITSPLIFFATLIPRTTQIVFGTGVMNLPQMPPCPQKERPWSSTPRRSRRRRCTSFSSAAWCRGPSPGCRPSTPTA